MVIQEIYGPAVGIRAVVHSDVYITEITTQCESGVPIEEIDIKRRFRSRYEFQGDLFLVIIGLRLLSFKHEEASK